MEAEIHLGPVFETVPSQSEEEPSSSATEIPVLPPPTTPVNLEVSAVPQSTQAPNKEPQKPSPKKPKKRKPKVPRDVTAPRQPLTGLFVLPT